MSAALIEQIKDDLGYLKLHRSAEVFAALAETARHDDQSHLEFLAALVRSGVTGVTRLRLDAALYGPAPPRRPGAIGRPRTKGERLPTLGKALADQTTAWQRVIVPDWYGEGERMVEICSETAV